MPKGDRTSNVAVSDSAQAMLRSLDSFLQSPWVFQKSKHPLQPQNPQSFVNNVYSPALRHTAASRRIMAGVDLVSVKEILGHRDIQTTMRYSPLRPAHLRQAVNRGGLGDHLRTITPTMPPGSPLSHLDGAPSQADCRLDLGVPHYTMSQPFR